MSETYMITAKTVEEAIAIANREYADENHEVSYEIIDMPKKGFLGIGAKDAKIKVTVSKSVSSELDSLVADLRGMKVLTAKGDSGERSPGGERSPEKKQNQQKKQHASDVPAQKQNAEKKPGEKKAPEAQKQNGEKNAQKQNQPKQNGEAKVQQKSGENKNQPKDAKPAEKQNQPKQGSEPKQNNQPKQGSEPKKERPADGEKNADKPAQKQNQPKQNNEKKAAPAPVKEEKAVPAPEVQAPDVPAEKAAEKAEVKNAEKRESGSRLNNQGKPQKRHQQKHGAPEQNIEATGVAVSAPMSLNDFVAEETEGTFGSAKNDTGKSAGRMNNDIRRSKKNQPKQSQDQKPAAAKSPKSDAKAERVIYEDRKSMITRYDVAESDEDYKKLDNLEDRELSIDEIRASMKANNTAVQESETSVDTDALDAAIEAAIDIAPKAEKTRREAVSEAEMNFALAFANTLLKNMGLDASAVAAACPEDEEFDVTEECTVYPKINIIGDDTGILIGHHGETLDAIQYLVNLSALRQSKQKDGDYVKIVVDIENYREKREETLRALARRMAARAVKYKRNVFLEPMNAYERRIIHSELQSVENVSTHSVGADRDRKIIITYEGEDKAPEKQNRRRRGSHGKGHGHAAGSEGASAPAETAESGAENTEKAQGSASNRERRRPRKVQKMPIEKIGDILPDGEAGNAESSVEE